MTHDEDARIKQLLQRHAPPERDPLFRVKVLERRERQWFRRRLALLLGAVLAIIVAAALGIGGGGKVSESARVVAILIAAAMAITIYAPLLMRLLRGYKS